VLFPAFWGHTITLVQLGHCISYLHADQTSNVISIAVPAERMGAVLEEELCTDLHVTQGHLSKIERGKTAPSLEMLILLSERFHKSVDWILRGEGISLNPLIKLSIKSQGRNLVRTGSFLKCPSPR
jgi:transcriptional regulator with XRE-family HTH domain